MLTNITTYGAAGDGSMLCTEQILVNDQLAGEFTPKRPYWYLSAWAVDITEHIEHSGANRIRLSLCAEGEYGAMMGLPQFCGDFKGVQNGLYSPLEIRCGES